MATALAVGVGVAATAFLVSSPFHYIQRRNVSDVDEHRVAQVWLLSANTEAERRALRRWGRRTTKGGSSHG